MTNTIFEYMMDDSIGRTLIHAVTYIVGAGVPGDLAEFGTWSGLTASIMARTLNEIDNTWPQQDPTHGIAKRNFHLFDSFVGLPEATHQVDTDSPHVKSGAWGKWDLVCLNVEQLGQAIDQYLPPERSMIYEGFFCDTLPELAPETRFALVHIDSDLYESAFQVLDYLFGNRMLSEGAILLFDDWNCNRASPRFGERKAWQEMLKKYTIEYSDEGSYAVFGHKFIIYSVSE